MGRDGKFHYIYLEQNIQGLYPRNDLYPADDLFPRDPKSNRIGKDLYITAEYEDFLVKTINKLQIREQKNDIGVIVGTGDNAYVIEDNFCNAFQFFCAFAIYKKIILDHISIVSRTHDHADIILLLPDL